MAFDYATISDLRTAEVITTEAIRLQTAREQLPNHPVLRAGYQGTVNGSGSATKKIPHIGSDGYDIMAPANDGATVSPTDPTDDSTTVTVARQSLAYEPTDLARMTGRQGQFDATYFAGWMLAGRNQRLITMIAALATGYSNTVGTSGSDMTAANFLDAKAQLAINDTEGDLLCILHPRQYYDFLNDLNNNASGTLQYEMAAQDLRDRVGNGYQGRFAGVDVWTSTRVGTANAGADRAGMMLGPGALAWMDGVPRVDLPGQQTLIDKVLYEIARSAYAGKTGFVGHAYLGVAEALDGAGVGIITDA